MAIIEKIIVRRVWDSRGNPTVEADVLLENGKTGRAIAPAGASRGTREAVDKRDGGEKLRGMNVQQALNNIDRIIAPALRGLRVDDQAAVDAAIRALDPSSVKENLGGNAAVAVSLAVLHAAAANADMPLYRYVAGYWNCAPTVPLRERAPRPRRC